MEKTLVRNKSIFIYVEWLIVFIFLAWTLLPIFWIVLTSFKETVDIFTVPPKIVFRPTLSNYIRAFIRGNFSAYFVNSLIIAVSSAFLSVLLGSMAGYSLARFRVYRKGLIAVLILFARMVPAIVLVIPLFNLMKNMGLLDSLMSVIIAHTTFNLPFVTWMMRGFFQELPAELEEAATVDGCSRTQAFLRVALPLTAPGLAATTILALLLSWNEFLFALVLTSVRTRTLPVAVSGFIGAVSVDWGGSTAAATVIMTPMVIAGLIVQKHLVRGLTMGAIKG
ncbi:MAG: carbohydrate ABC transporter permease [Firmicutes bacterium]|nr:carbohydrate ABC transporter permease [Bacillota bacterium]